MQAVIKQLCFPLKYDFEFVQTPFLQSTTGSRMNRLLKTYLAGWPWIRDRGRRISEGEGNN